MQESRRMGDAKSPATSRFVARAFSVELADRKGSCYARRGVGIPNARDLTQGPLEVLIGWERVEGAKWNGVARRRAVPANQD